jgi:hypothetical protein
MITKYFPHIPSVEFLLMYPVLNFCQISIISKQPLETKVSEIRDDLWQGS